MRHKHIDTAMLCRMYQDQNLTLREIAFIVGMSFIAVRKRVMGAGIMCRSIRGTSRTRSAHGCYEAHKAVEPYFRLAPGNVVHHKDNNETNNNKENLAVFANRSDHMAYHWGRKIPFLWDGASD